MLDHMAAREVAWFVVLVFSGIALVLWRDFRKEQKHGLSK